MSFSKSIAKEALIDISEDANNSLSVNTDGMLLTGIIFPATMTGTAVTFDYSLDETTFYDVVETVANMQSESRAKTLEEKVKLLQQREQELVRLDAEKELKAKHPDFDDIRNSDDFHAWAKSQPESIQGWIYSNASDPEAASRALDLFKSATLFALAALAAF